MTFTYPSHTTKGCVPLSSDVTIEEKIIKLQQMKKELAEEILSGDEIKTASFQREELLELLEERF